jgi:hypothetical protein
MFRSFSERLIHLNLSLHPNKTRNPTGTECPDYPAPSPPGDPCTPRHSPRDAYPPFSPGGRPCLGMW